MSYLFVLDLWPTVRPDSERFIRTAMRWYFGSDTGSAYWLKRAADHPFDPLTDVKEVEDLRLFPDRVDELRQVIDQYHIDSRVLPQGPGHSKILITVSVGWHAYPDTVVSSPVNQRMTLVRKVGK